MANTEQIDYLIELVSQVPSLRVVNARGASLLTPREEQVVALVAEGLSNREVAQELALSEHTIKKYLFRIFDRLGIPRGSSSSSTPLATAITARRSGFPQSPSEGNSDLP